VSIPDADFVSNLLPDKQRFETAYAGEAPWDIGRPQTPFAALVDRVEGPILDAGCGTGEHALLFAAKGHQVTGIDFVEEAVRRAGAKATERRVTATFLVMDVLTLSSWDTRFKTVIDSGLFHVFSDEDRRRYVAGLSTVVLPGGRLYLMCFGDEEPGTQGPRRVSTRELRDSFADGFEIESIEPSRFEVDAKFAPIFSEGGPKAWFATIRRVARG
jgi:SAM-dependent methyltransferase